MLLLSKMQKNNKMLDYLLEISISTLTRFYQILCNMLVFIRLNIECAHE